MTEWDHAILTLGKLRGAVTQIPEPAAGLKGDAAADAARAESARCEAMTLLGRVDAQLRIGRALANYARGAGAVVLAVVLGAAPAAAQRATADLIAVDSGRVDAGIGGDTREMCLRRSAYVLAFDRGPADDDGIAAVGTGDADPVAAIVLSESDQDGWAWRAFAVGDDTCYRLVVFNGRARVYLLRVGVDW